MRAIYCGILTAFDLIKWIERASAFEENASVICMPLDSHWKLIELCHQLYIHIYRRHSHWIPALLEPFKIFFLNGRWIDTAGNISDTFNTHPPHTIINQWHHTWLHCAVPTYIYMCRYKFVGRSEIGLWIGPRHCATGTYSTATDVGLVCVIYTVYLYSVSCRVHTDYFQAQAPRECRPFRRCRPGNENVNLSLAGAVRVFVWPSRQKLLPLDTKRNSLNKVCV